MLNRLRKQSLLKILIMIWNVFRMTLLKVFKRNKVKVSLIQNIHPTTEIAVKGGRLVLEHSVFTRKNVCFRVESGELVIGTSFFNQGCCVTAMKKVIIGDNCLFGPNVVIVDHDHDYSFLNTQRGNHYKYGQVKIGNNVWIGANVTILRGTIIGDNCVIGAGCIVRGKVEENTLLYDKNNQVRKIIREGLQNSLCREV